MISFEYRELFSNSFGFCFCFKYRIDRNCCFHFTYIMLEINVIIFNLIPLFILLFLFSFQFFHSTNFSKHFFFFPHKITNKKKIDACECVGVCAFLCVCFECIFLFLFCIITKHEYINSTLARMHIV